MHLISKFINYFKLNKYVIVYIDLLEQQLQITPLDDDNFSCGPVHV